MDSHLLITRRCLDLLQSTPERETSALDHYASVYLFDHLQVLKDKADKLDLSEKVLIVEELISLLHAPELVKEHLGESFLQLEKWLVDEEIETMQWWLQLRGIAPKLNQRSQRWLEQALSGDQLHPYRELAEAIAHGWLCSRKLHSYYLYSWIRRYVSQSAAPCAQIDEQHQVGEPGQVSSANTPVQSTIDAWSDDMKEVEKITYDAHWAVNTFNITNYSAYYQRLAETYYCFGEGDLQIRALLEAKKLFNHDWTVLVDLSNAYVRKGNNHLAARTIMDAFAEARQRKEMMIDAENNSVRNELAEKAAWLSSIGQLSYAENTLQEVIPTMNGESYTAHIGLLLKTGRVTETLDFVNNMGNKTSGTKQQEQLTQLGSMFIESSYLYRLQTLEELFFVSKDEESSQMISKALGKALENKEENANLIGLHLISGLAEVFYSSGDAGSSLHKAVKH